MRIPRYAAMLTAALAFFCLRASGQTVPGPEVGKFPTAAPLSGTERLLADQNQNTVNITPVQLANFIGLPAGLSLPVSIVNGGTGTNNASQGLINLLPTLVANDCLAANSSATVVLWQACGSGGSGIFQANGTNLSSSSTINFQNGAATDGLTLLFSNPSAGNVKLGMSGTLSFAGGGTGLSATPSNGQLLIGNGSGYALSTLTAGNNVSITNTAGGISIAATAPTGPVFQTNASGLSSSSTVNFENSAPTNGLTLTFANPSAGNVQLGVTGFPSLVSGECLSNNGTALNWASCTPGGGGTVVSVNTTLPAPFSASGCSYTVSGTCAITWATGQTAHQVLGSDSGAFAPEFLVAADLPNIGANPSASVGLTTVPGSATTYMRSDAAPALSQAISPTMSGNWTYTATSGNLRIAPGGATYAGGWAMVDAQTSGHTYQQIAGYCNGATAGTWSLNDVTNSASRVCIDGSGAATFEAPSAGNTLTANGLSNNYALAAVAGSTSGQAYGIFVRAGTTAADSALRIVNQSNSAALFRVAGDGGALVGNPTGGDEGAGSVNAQSFYINGSQVFAPAGANPTATVGLTAVNGSATTFLRSDSAPALSQSISPTMSGAWTFTSNANAIAPSTSTFAESFHLNDQQSGGHSYGEIAGFCNGAQAGYLGFYDYTVGGGSKGCISPTGNWIFNAPSAGVAMTVEGASGTEAFAVSSGNSASAAFPDSIVERSGSVANSIDAGPSMALFDFTNSTQTVLQQSGGQSELWQYNGGWNQIWKALSTRGMVINAPAGGQTLTLNVNNNASGFAINDGTSIFVEQTDSNHNHYLGTNGGYAFNLITNDTPRLSLGANGNVTVLAPSSGVAFSATGASGARIANFNGVGSTSYVEFDRSSSENGFVGSGDSLFSGGLSSDFGIAAVGGLSLGVNNSTLAMHIGTDTGITAGSPTGGDEGAGTINAQNLYVNGAAVLTTVSPGNIKIASGVVAGGGGACAIGTNFGGFASCAYNGVGNYSVTMTSGYFVNSYACTATASSSSALFVVGGGNVVGSGAASFTLRSLPSGTLVDGAMTIICTGS